MSPTKVTQVTLPNGDVVPVIPAKYAKESLAKAMINTISSR